MHGIGQSPFVTGAGELWPKAPRAKFLDAVASGSLPAAAFQRWLVQDYLFVRGAAGFQTLTIAKAPRAAQKLLISGLNALEVELTWFEEHAARLQLDLRSQPHRIGRRYVDFLLAAAYTRPFPVLAAIVFASEVSYLAAWSRLRPEGPYAEVIRRWSNPQFAEYVQALAALSEQHPHAEQQAAFNEVLAHEEDFWRMTWEG